MIPMTFEESIRLDLENTESWLLKNNLLDKEGRIYHSVFLKTEEDAKEVLKCFLNKGYRDSYADILEDDEYPFLLEFAKTIVMNKEHIDIDIKNVLNLLKSFHYDYNNFTVLVDINEDETKFFNPNEVI